MFSTQTTLNRLLLYMFVHNTDSGDLDQDDLLYEIITTTKLRAIKNLLGVATRMIISISNNIRTECGKIKNKIVGYQGTRRGDNLYNNIIMYINTNCCDTLHEVTHAKEDRKRKVHLYNIIPALRLYSSLI